MEKLNSFVISGIPRVHFGNGSFSNLISIIKSFGKNVLLVTGKESFSQSTYGTAFLETLTHSKIKSYHISVKGEPSPHFIDSHLRDFRNRPINVVVAIGGGSVIDAGKAFSAMLAEEGSVSDYLEGVGTRKPSGIKAPFIAVPTTAGTGSEATKNAVLSSVGFNGFKKSLRHDNYIPDVAIVDPELTLSCSAALTAACGLDAICQLFESYTSTNSNPYTDSLALDGLKHAAHSFPNLLTSQDNDLQLRGMMSYASLLSGITLSQAGLGTIHGIAGIIGGFYPIPHGNICGLLLYPVVSRMISLAKEEQKLHLLNKIETVGRIISPSKNQSPDFYYDTVSETFGKWIKLANLPTLTYYGITEKDIPLLSGKADNKSSPVQFTAEQISDIIRDAL